jgi:hypothetical protein
LAEDAVSCEPVSALNSLETGKITGNFADFGTPLQFARAFRQKIQCLPGDFPIQWKQGISGVVTGNCFVETGAATG